MLGVAAACIGRVIALVHGGLGFAHAIEPLRTAHVREQMTMKKPVARPIRKPCDLQPLARAHHRRHPHPGDHGWRRESRVDRESAPVDAKEEAVQMHLVPRVRRVDEMPAHRVVHGVRETFRVGPRPSVDRVQLKAFVARRPVGFHRVNTSTRSSGGLAASLSESTTSAPTSCPSASDVGTSARPSRPSSARRRASPRRTGTRELSGPTSVESSVFPAALF